MSFCNEKAHVNYEAMVQATFLGAGTCPKHHSSRGLTTPFQLLGCFSPLRRSGYLACCQSQRGQGGHRRRIAADALPPLAGLRIRRRRQESAAGG